MNFFDDPAAALAEAAEDFANLLFSPTMAVAYGIIIAFYIWQAWQQGLRSTFTWQALSGSGASLIIYSLNFLFSPIVFFAVTFLHDFYASFNIPSVPQELWAELPFWLVGILAIVGYDLADYWNHRLMHVSFLWPIHAIHHSDHDVNGFTTFRIHLLEALVMQVSYIVLLSWAGIPAEAAAFGGALATIHNVYVHYNLDWDHGPFKLLLASPQFHRWHHADVEEAYGKNLANMLPIYDYIFGTYYEGGTCNEKMGIKGVPHADVVTLFFYPFAEWGRMLKRQFARQSNPIESQPQTPRPGPAE